MPTLYISKPSFRFADPRADAIFQRDMESHGNGDDRRSNGEVAVVEESEPDDGGGGEAKAETGEGPPMDDCCPICFGSFSVPCRSDCGHWYCGSCILQYWNYSSAPKNCKCPMCSRHINMLVPDSSLCPPQDDEVVKVLESVRRYNNLFVGGIRGVVQKICGLPLFVKRIFREMMDPDRPNSYVHEMRLFAMLLSILYTASPFDFIPTGSVGVVRLFDYGAIGLIITLRLVGIYRRRRLTQRVRNLAAIEQ